MAKDNASQSRLAKLFGIDATAHGDSQWSPESKAELEVIGLGMSRTGTSSLRAALDILGFGPVHHGVPKEIYRRPDHRERVTAFTRWLNEHPEQTKNPTPELRSRMRKVFYGYRATMDAPLCDLGPELFYTYPTAKFILSVRSDGDAGWWKSWIESVGYHFDSGPRRWLYRSLISSVTLLRRMDVGTHEIRTRLVRDFGSIGPHIYGQHNKQVRKLIPKERLLEFNVREGWGPLCEFLGVDVPEGVPFPNFNESAGIKAIYAGQMIFGAATWAFYAACVGGLSWVAMRPDVVKGWLERASSLLK